MSSDANRWQRVRQVFQAALEWPESDRVRFLRDVCADDSDLRRDVESLLEAAAAGNFLESPSTEDLNATGASIASRDTALGDTCNSDEDLRREIQLLLAHD